MNGATAVLEGDLIQRIPFRAEPLPLESGRGFLLRLSYELGFGGVSNIAQLAGIPLHSLSAEAPLGKLAAALRIEDPELLRRNFYALTDIENKSGQRTFLDQAISPNFLGAWSTKVCPLCLAERQVQWAIWDLTYVAVCPAHGCMLIDHCPRCNTRLSSKRKGVHLCSCGFDIRGASATPAQKGVLKLSKLIYQHAGHEVRDSLPTEPGYPVDLKISSLQNLLRLIQFFGSRFHSPDPKMGQCVRWGMDVSKAHDLVAVAHEIFADWPIGFHGHLARIQKNYTVQDINERSVKECFGHLYRRIYQDLKEPEFDFVRLAFEDYLGRSWDGLPRWHNRWVVESTSGMLAWMTATQASIETDGLINRQCFKKLVSNGALKGVFGEKGPGGRSMLWIERSSFLRWMEEVGKWISLAGAIRQLGISRESMEALGVSGIVRYSLESIPGSSHGCKFLKEDVNRISMKFDVCDAHIVPYSKGGKLISLRHAVKDLIGSKQGLITVIQGVISGKLKPHGRVGTGNGILDYLFMKSEIVCFQSAGNGQGEEQFICKSEVMRLLQINEDVLNALIRVGYLKVADEFKDWFVRYFSLSDVLSFQAKYVSAKTLAKQEKTSAAGINRSLCRQKIPFIAVYGSPGRQTCFFESSSLEAAGLSNRFGGSAMPEGNS